MNSYIRIGFVATVLLCFTGGLLPVHASLDDTTGRMGLNFGHFRLGVVGVKSENNTNVLPYNEQESTPVADFSTLWVKGGTHIGLDGAIEGEDDYSGNFYLDLHGLVRLNVRDEGLYHRLTPLSFPTGATGVDYVDRAVDNEYHVDFRQQDVVLKVSPPLLASHAIVKYRRIVLTGEKQLHYLDENCSTGQCHINNRKREVDQKTEEYALLLDAHLGALEVGAEHLQRTFGNNAEPVVDTFDSAGSSEHDFVTGNTFRNSTLKAHTSLAGGLVLAGSASVGARENETDLTDVSPVTSKTDIRKAAGDLTWTPLPLLTMAFRYRITDIDRESSRFYTSPAVAEIAEGMDITRNSYAATAVVQATDRITLRGGYHREEIRRDHVVDNGFWTLPENENIDRFSLDAQCRPFRRNSTRFDLGYQYQHSSDPTYAMSLQENHRVKANFRLNPSPTWGGIIALRGEQGSNGGLQATTSQGEMVFDRSSVKKDATISLWKSPWKRVTIGGSFGFSHTVDEQDLSYGQHESVDVIASDAESKQIVRNASLFLNVGVGEKIDWAFDLHRVRGSYKYDPDFIYVLPSSATVTDDYLSELGSVEIVQEGLSANVQWEPVSHWILGLKYAYDRYNDRKGSTVDGTVQSLMATVAKTW